MGKKTELYFDLSQNSSKKKGVTNTVNFHGYCSIRALGCVSLRIAAVSCGAKCVTRLSNRMPKRVSRRAGEGDNFKVFMSPGHAH